MAPHFKKLTDCPENLRESIDWLIQVRHGGDGQGLEKLAKSLKKLIEDAIEKAYTTNVSVLLKLFDAFKSYKCCKEKVTEIEKLNEAKKSTNESLNTILERLNNLNDCFKNHLDSSQRKAYDEIESNLEQLIKLEEGLKGITNENSCKELLANLCSGLETFLGFDPSSKGYTGEGIVYSDLDRLCDAVMAFLHGVLEGVKDYDAVKTYDGYITAKDGKQLEDVLNNLKRSIGHGSDGLTTQVMEVSKWIGRYDEKMKEKAETVTNPLKVLKSNIDSHLNRINCALNANKVLPHSTLETHVTQCIATSKKCIKDILNTENSGFQALDSHLHTKIGESARKIKREVKRFEGSAFRDAMHLQDVSNKVEIEMNTLEANVKDEVTTKVGAYRHRLSSEFATINKEINDVSSKMGGQLQNLHGWIAKAQALVDAAIPQIENILNEIEKDGHEGDKPKLIKENASKLQSKAEALRDAVEQAKRVLKPLVNTIKGHVTALESVYKKTLNALQNTVQAHVSAAQGVLEGLQAKVTTDLDSTVKGLIKTHIDKVINSFQEGVKKAVEDGTSTIYLIQGFREGLASDVSLSEAESKLMYNWADAARSGLSGALERLNDIKTFKELLEQLENFKPKGTGLDGSKNFFDCFKADLESKLAGAIQSIKGAFHKHMPNYNAYSRNAKGGDIHDAIDKVQQKVEEYFEDDDADGTGKKVKQGKLDHNGYDRKGVDNEIEKIDKAGLQPFEKFGKEDDNKIDNSTFGGLLVHITQTLQDLIQEIQKNANGTGGILRKLNDLKGTYFKTPFTDDADITSIHKIYKDLDELRSKAIHELIEKAKTFLGDTIPQQSEYCINEIHKKCVQEVKNAKERIIIEVQKQYRDARVSEMGILKGFVEKETKIIEDIIFVDMNTGVKGLVKLLKDNIDCVSKASDLAYLATKFRDLSGSALHYVIEEIKSPGEAIDKNENAQNASGIKEKLDTLLAGIRRSRHFDHNFKYNMELLNTSLSAFIPAVFSGIYNPALLDALKHGLTKFVEELRKAYVNTYSGATFEDILMDMKYVVNTSNSNPRYELNEYGEKCAKVCLTAFSIFFNNLTKLKDRCMRYNWRQKQLNLTNELGECFQSCGYIVSKKANSHEGQLRNCSGLKDIVVVGLLTKDHKIFISYESDEGNVKTLFTHLQNYNRVCHTVIPSTTKYPVNIYQILEWCSGFRYNCMYDKVCRYFKTFFTKPETRQDSDYNTIDALELTLSATRDFSAQDISDTLYEVCTYAEKTLITILGYGDADGRYACEFNTNVDGLEYPNDAGKCFDLLVEILSRLYNQLYFLCIQCERTSDAVSWRDCWYGKQIGGSSWQCNDLKCGECDYAKGCKNHPACGIKSPLQSFLEDGLPGFLPHPFDKPDCKITCSLSNHQGIPCKTPMGFTDISKVSSHTKTGAYLVGVLRDFCGNKSTPLATICAYTTCLLHRPPQTLSDLFSFLFGYINGWGKKDRKHKSDAFGNAVTKAYFCQPYTALNVAPIFNSSDNPTNHKQSDLLSLFWCDHEPTSATTCGRYMQPLGLYTWVLYSTRNADRYLSWIVYLSETFYDLLETLYNECHNNCNKPGTRCHGKTCHKTCEVRYGSKRVESRAITKTYHTDACKSIAICPFSRPTLYKYGFVLNSFSNLNGKSDLYMKRTCEDLCKALERVISKKISDEAALAKLIYETLPNFLWSIREKFFWTTLTLWLLSLLYLLHIMVIRLDLLHIKSHLHSPSSHRIAAQSLLAAARVNKLAKLTYLQP